MTAFYVGQRVRVVKSMWGYVGKEATIIGPLTPAENENGEWDGYPLFIDGVGTLSPLGRDIYASPDRIEPLTGPNAHDLEAAKTLLNSLPAYVPGLAHV